MKNTVKNLGEAANKVLDKKLAKLQEEIDHTEQFGRVASLFSHLSDLNRIRIFWALCHSEICTSTIAETLNMSSPATAHHIKLLREAGLIEGNRQGKEVYYKATSTLETKALHEAIESMLEISCPLMRFDN